jgi:hypothetical protein
LAQVWQSCGWRSGCHATKRYGAQSLLKFRTSFFMEIYIKMLKHFMRKNKNLPGNCSKIVSMNEAHTLN